ncbi:hypothetical protein ACQ4M4_13310 [Leptolyngbya sp. AN02str]|uniref:hypothetical protein n=1 Tax=Leptolyngbya sp. AN02str TaxID=3423363 RepID=UPI003D322D0D
MQGWQVIGSRSQLHRKIGAIDVPIAVCRLLKCLEKPEQNVKFNSREGRSPVLMS